MLYDKTSALPPKGSLREALFLTVWLKRQEQELQRTRILAQGLLEASPAKESTIGAAYKDYLGALLPYAKKAQDEKDKELTDRMKKEVEKGVLVFKTPSANKPLLDRAKQMSLPDEFRQKLRAKKRVVEL